MIELIKNNVKKVLATIVVLLGLGGVSLGAALPQAVGIFETSLQSGISSSATTLTLTANSIRGGGSLSGYNCFTIDEGSSNAEVVCGTVATLTVSSLTRGISYENGTSTVSANQFSHRRGANVKITDFPIIQILKAQNNGQDTFPNILTYASQPTFTDAKSIITKFYSDNQANQGAATSSETIAGIIEQATQIEMASSTAFDANNPHTINSEYATSTPDGTSQAGLFAVISKNNGKIHQLWLDLTEVFPFSGNNTFAGTSIFNDDITSNATSTFNGGITGLVNYQVFTSSGTWTKPSNLNASSTVAIACWGGGGAGGGKTTSNSVQGGGGGGGGYNEVNFLASALGSTETVTIGAGGTGVSANNGNAGGNTTFGSFITSYGGGGGGVDASGAGSGAGGGGSFGAGVSASGLTAGAGGLPVGGTAGSNSAGGDGNFGGGGGADGGAYIGGISVYGGAGGGSGASGSASAIAGGASIYGGAGGGSGANTGNTAGNGGVSFMGGNGGAGGDGSAGVAGTAPAGGGGGAGDDSTTAYAGGAGASGECRVTTNK